MEFTGERYLPDIDGEIRQEHLHRYAMALAHVPGRRVLDIACGEGYGSALMARAAEQVIGVDISEAVIAHAREAYAHIPRLQFLAGSAAQLPLADASVDMVVSFETIEHHDQHEEMMLEFVRVLRPGGLLLLSSPNKAVYSDEAQFKNEFHVKELYFDELDALTRRHFRNVTYLGQRFVTGSTILPLADETDARADHQIESWTDDGVDVTARLPRLQSPMYFVLLATNGERPAIGKSSLLLSEASDLFLEFRQIARWASGVHRELEAAQAHARNTEQRLRAEVETTQAAAESAQLQQRESTTLLQALRSDHEDLLEQKAAAERARDELDRAWHAQLQALEETHRFDLAQKASLFAEAEQRLTAAQAHQVELAGQLRERDAALQQLREQLAASALSFEAERGNLGRQLVAEQAKREAAELALQHERRAASGRENEARAEAQRLRQVLTLQQERAQLQEQRHAASALQAGAEAQRQLEQIRREWRGRLAAAQWDGRRRERSAKVALAATEQLVRNGQHALRVVEAAWQQRWTDAIADQRQAMQAREAAAAAQYSQLLDQAAAERQASLAREATAATQIDALHAEALRTQALVASLLQRAHMSEQTWQQRLADLQAQADALAHEADTRMARQQLELQYRSELAALLARHLLERASSMWRQRSAYGHGWDAASWRELALEALAPPAPASAPLRRPWVTNHQSTDMSKLPPASSAAISSVDDLLLIDDHAFVLGAYQALLGRQPDAEGLKHYLHALRQGEPRLQILHDMRHSTEGRERSPQLRGFDEAMRRLRYSRLPMVGRLFRRQLQPTPALGLRRKLEGLADDLGRSLSRTEERLANIEQLLRQSSAQAEQHAQAGVLAAMMSRYSWSADADVWRMAQQLAGSTNDRFVGDVFGFMLGRAPHGYELMHFREMLSLGSSRALLLDKILQSAEFARDHAPLGLLAPKVSEEHTASTPLLQHASTLPSLPIYAEPVVSVIVPIYGKLDYTLRCLRSIAMHRPAVPFEVIVVDDCSPDNSAEVLAQVPGIHLERNPSNLGFIRSCNRGAALARGSYLCFLNNDTEVHSGWLDELYATFEIFPGTGLVGSKLIYPDGTLQEAGGILWQNGNAWNFGRGQDPALPVFNYAREVDYCSGASIMLSKDLFDELGGFDEHYLPAYCEDSDLALKVRDRGLRVIYQPMSVVTHHEGITSGTDTGSGTKAYQIANSKKLFERWKERLAAHQPDAENPDEAKDRMHRMRVLVLEHCTPTPDQDAGSVSVFNMLLLLREMGFQVTFIAEDNFLYMPDYTVMLQRAGIEVLYGPYVTSVKQHVQDLGKRYDLVFLFRPVVVERHIETIRTHCPQARVLFYTHDIHHIRMEREAALLQSTQRAAEAAVMKERELRAIRSVDSTIVVSTAEMEILQPQLPDQQLQMLPLLLNVPGTEKAFHDRQGLLFVGGYQHTPNVDAVRFFVGEVMPLVRELLPGVVLNVVGSKPPPEILALAAKDVVIHGFVEDLAPLLDEVRVSVAPLRYGAGVKGKVGTALAAGLPTVATPVAAEGMGLIEGEQLLVASSAADLAECVHRLYTDPELWARLSEAGIRAATAMWGPAASFAQLSSIVRQLGLDTPTAADHLVLYRAGLFSPAAR
jgi:GT2 family glycosyltransferase/ubiquinone/menaquinone biosynthesis C-methylase UbiE